MNRPKGALGPVIQDTRKDIPLAPREDVNFRSELDQLFRALPQAVANCLHDVVKERGINLYALTEIYIQIGRKPEAIFVNHTTGQKERVFITELMVESSDIQLFADTFDGEVPAHHRIGVEGTLHRISLIVHPTRSLMRDHVLGVTARVGRVVQGTVERMAAFMLQKEFDNKSLVLIGRPGVGKTTVLREYARLLSADTRLNVIVVDKTCELAGDSATPHSAIGSARWMPVGKPHMQHQVLREAVENQSPDVIIVDEISTPDEVEAARSIAQRGVRLIATIHGDTLPEILNCRERGNLLGGQTSVTLSDGAAAQRADRRKTVQKRLREPVFQHVLELHERERWIFHPNVKTATDSYLNGEPVDAEELFPGMRHKIVAVPDEDHFTYCRECARGHECAAHAPPPPPPPGRAPSQARGGGNMQRSGSCYRCGEPGHFARFCTNTGVCSTGRWSVWR